MKQTERCSGRGCDSRHLHHRHITGNMDNLRRDAGAVQKEFATRLKADNDVSLMGVKQDRQALIKRVETIPCKLG